MADSDGNKPPVVDQQKRRDSVRYDPGRPGGTATFSDFDGSGQGTGRPVWTGRASSARPQNMPLRR